MNSIENLEENKFAYFWNAIHYCLWLMNSFQSKFGDRLAEKLDKYIGKL